MTKIPQGPPVIGDLIRKGRNWWIIERKGGVDEIASVGVRLSVAGVMDW